MIDQQKAEAIAQLEQTMRACGILEFSGEVQLLEWAKSTSRDMPKIKFGMLDDEAVAPFESATIRKGKQAGQLYHIFAVRLDEPSSPVTMVPAKPEKRPPNELARKLMADGYFRNSRLWDAMERGGFYTQSQHKKHVENMACCKPRMYVWESECSGDVVAHHCASAALPASGNPESPRKVAHWYTVPLCYKHHSKWAHGTGRATATREEKQKLLEHAVALTERAMKEAAKRVMGIESLSEITPETLAHFERSVVIAKMAAPVQ